MRTVNVCGDDRCKVASVFLVVAFVHHVNHSLRIGIARIRGMWWSTVDHCFIDWVCSLVRKNACREEGYKLHNFVVFATLHDIIIN